MLNTQTSLIWLGLIISLLGVATLLYMGYMGKTQNRDFESEEDKNLFIQKLIIFNFAGLGMGVIGLIIIVLSRLFK